MIQLDFFLDDEALIRLEIEKVRESTEKVRRGMFARHNELAKHFVDLDERLRIIEKHICRG